MADVKISALTAKGANLATTDRLAIAEVGGGSFNSKHITGSEIINGVKLTTTRAVSSFPNTLSLADANKFIKLDSGSANVTTIPPNSSVAFATGTRIEITQSNSGQSQIVAGSGVTLRAAGGASKLSAQYATATLLKVATDEWYLFGSITT